MLNKFLKEKNRAKARHTRLLAWRIRMMKPRAEEREQGRRGGERKEGMIQMEKQKAGNNKQFGLLSFTRSLHLK
jgi:hypothetical protein